MASGWHKTTHITKISCLTGGIDETTYGTFDGRTVYGWVCVMSERPREDGVYARKDGD